MSKRAFAVPALTSASASSELPARTASISAFSFAAPLCDCLLHSRERKWVATVRLDRLELGDERSGFGLSLFVGLEEVVETRDHESPLPGLLVDVRRPQPSGLL